MTIETFKNLTNTLPETGTKFKATIRSTKVVTVEGLIYNIKGHNFYLCYNSTELNGIKSPNMQGYERSWKVGEGNCTTIDIEIEHINNEYSIF